MYAHRGPPGMSPRYLELLEMLKSEYESMYHEVSMNKIHREDAESKCKLHNGWIDFQYF